MMRAGSSKNKAVTDALFRLRMHVRGEAVVQALAEQGVGGVRAARVNR